MKKTSQKQHAVTHRIPMPPSNKEISRLLSYVRSKPRTRDLRDVVRIMASTGIRAGDLSDKLLARVPSSSSEEYSGPQDLRVAVTIHLRNGYLSVH